MEISGGNQSLLNLYLSYYVNSIFSLVRPDLHPYILNFTNIDQYYRYFFSFSFII